MSVGWLFLASIAAGLVGAVSGLGGGVVLIPVLTFFGVDIKRAIALSVLSVITVSSGAALVYVRRHLPNLKISAFLDLFAVFGALIGASLTLVSARGPLFLLCGGVIVVSSLWLWRQQRHPWTPARQQDAFSKRLELAGSYYDSVEQHTITYGATRAAMAGPLMFGTGVLSGWLGLGSSALTVLIHDAVLGLPPKVSLTTSNLIIGVMALASASVYLEAGMIDPQLAAPVILGVPLGALLGSRLLLYSPNRSARLICLSALIVFGIELIVHGLRGA